MSRRRVTECQAARNSQLMLRAPSGPSVPRLWDNKGRPAVFSRRAGVECNRPEIIHLGGMRRLNREPSAPGGNGAERLLRVLAQPQCNQ